MTWKRPNAKTKHEIDYIVDLIQDVAVLNSFNTSSVHQIIRKHVIFNKKNYRKGKREKQKMTRKYIDQAYERIAQDVKGNNKNLKC